MPRSLAILQSEFPYNISARCINRDWFSVPMPIVWEIFCEELTKANKDLDLQIHSFVLMTNHFHLLASTPQSNISQCMQQFMRRSSLRLTRAGNRINETYAGRHFKCVLQQPNYFYNAYKYNYRNPVKAQICNLVEEYPFSTLRSVMGIDQPKIPILEDVLFHEDPVGILKWLNQAPDPVKAEAVRCGLRHQYFRSKKFKNYDIPIINEYERI